MRVFVGGVSSEYNHAGCTESFLNIRLRPGDERKYQWRTRGDIARIELCREFLGREEFDALFLADVDMHFDPDVLERLREHDLDAVSGHYFRRRFNPMISIACVSPDGEWPYHPLWDIPEDGLIEIVMAGFGCILLKRGMLEAIKISLPSGTEPFALGAMPEMSKGDHGPFGSDYLFSHEARKLGYKLWLDCNPKAEARHATTVFLDRSLYKQVRGQQLKRAAKYWGRVWALDWEINGMDAKATEARISQLRIVLEDMNKELAEVEAHRAQLVNRIAVASGQLAEREIDAVLYKQEEEKAPRTLIAEDAPPPKLIGRLPVFRSEEEAQKALANRDKGYAGETPVDAIKRRDEVKRVTASDFVGALDEPAD